MIYTAFAPRRRRPSQVLRRTAAGIAFAATLAACAPDESGSDQIGAETTAGGSTATADSLVWPRVQQLQRTAPSGAMVPPTGVVPAPFEQERYADLKETGWQSPATAPFSTFSIDVDTGAYANVRRFLEHGQMPPADAVRIEELLNYFDYAYAPPADTEIPFAVHTALAPAPWNRDRLLLRIGLKGFEPAMTERPAANLVFLIDVSGSMNQPKKLPLVVSSLKLLTRRLDADDRVAIVTYAGQDAIALDPTPGNETAKITRVLDRLAAGGGTAGAAGLHTAYDLARESFVEGGINRVVLATDGDFNVGISDQSELEDLISRQRRSGIALTTLGFGTGNYREAVLERLADLGNGNYAYIDRLSEARKVLDAQAAGTLMTIAKDVKIQMDFNPALVAEYRLIGYENRRLADRDFADDSKDAGEIGAGHTVTALYEITPVGSPARLLPPSRYAAPKPAKTEDEAVPNRTEIGFLKLRWKRPDGDTSMATATPIRLADSRQDIAEADADFRFAAAVAAWGMLLRDPDALPGFGFERVSDLARGGLGDDRHGYRRGLLDLIDDAGVLADG